MTKLVRFLQYLNVLDWYTCISRYCKTDYNFYVCTTNILCNWPLFDNREFKTLAVLRDRRNGQKFYSDVSAMKVAQKLCDFMTMARIRENVFLIFRRETAEILTREKPKNHQFSTNKKMTIFTRGRAFIFLLLSAKVNAGVYFRENNLGNPFIIYGYFWSTRTRM